MSINTFIITLLRGLPKALEFLYLVRSNMVSGYIMIGLRSYQFLKLALNR